MDIKLDTEQMQAVVTKALFDNMTPERRDEIFKAALQHVMTPQETGYGYGRDKKTPFMLAVQTASENVVRSVVKDMLEADEGFKANLKAIFADVAEKLFESGVRDKLVETMADSVVSGLKADRY